jgi:hypothetical protein
MAGNNEAIRVAILRHLYDVRQQEATATNGALRLDQLSAALKKKGYKHGEVESTLDRLVAKGLVTEVVEHRRIVIIPGTADNPEIRTYRISGFGIDQVQAERAPGAGVLTILKWVLGPVSVAGILGVIVRFVFFPFNLLTSVPAAIAIGTALGLGWIGFRNGRRLFFAASVVTLLAGIAWATLGLFVVLQKPLYCYSSDTTSLVKGEVFRVDAGKPLGNVFYITDPVRKSTIIRRTAQTLSPQIIFIEGREENGQHAILIPMTDAVVHQVSGTGDARSAEEIWLAYVGPTLQVGTHDPTRNIKVGFGFTCVPIIYFLQKSSDKPGLPWQAVIYDPAGESKSVLYVSYLDVALSAAARDDLGTSVETLELSYKYASSEIERARNRVLLADLPPILSPGIMRLSPGLSSLTPPS